MGVLVYMVSVGYQQTPQVTVPEIAVEIPVEKNKKRATLITEGESRGQIKVEAGQEKAGFRPMPKGPPPALDAKLGK